MKTFKEFPKDGKTKCPICGTNDNKECVLIPIYGTQDGNISEATIYHLDCIELFEYVEADNVTIIAQNFMDKRRTLK